MQGINKFSDFRIHVCVIGDLSFECVRNKYVFYYY